MTLSPSSDDTTFVDILNGSAPGTIVARDDHKRLAIIRALHPEAAVHWLAIPFEAVPTIEELEKNHRQRFLELIDFAVSETKARTEEYPLLGRGFTIKFHFGSFETVRHAKLHILSSE